jgi:2-polyprenyl-6-methoxyphenol hydroxylase-like FAD-dependent oxidoreductase
MEQCMDTQVLVVGAGPVGLTMAAELTRYGARVRIVEKAAQRTDKSKAIVIWSRTLELFDRADCSDTLVDAGHKVNGANIIGGKKVVGHLNIATTVDSPYAYALILPQSETERLLENHLGRLGVRVERQVEATAMEKNSGGVATVLRHADGREETLQTEWLIGCDGCHSMVRHALGLSFEGETLQSNWILADIHVQGYPYPDSEIATYWHELGILLMMPITPGRYRIIADISQAAGAEFAEPTLAQVQGIIDERGPGGLVASDPVWLSAFRINERKVGDYRSGRAFVAGDAAHVHSPAGGQGMNTGMQDAFNLAWKLALVCHGTCTDGKLLDSFGVERSAVGELVLKSAGRLTAVAMLKNHAAQNVRNLVAHVMFGFAPVRQAMANAMSEVSIGYDHSPLNGPSVHGISGPSPGQRIVPVAGQVPVGSGNRPRFALFAEPGSALKPLLEKYGALLDPVVRPPFHADAVWLVRPDGYVACVAKKGDTKTISDYLDGLCSA